MKKRIGVLLFAAACCLMLCATVFASPADDAAEALSTAGIFRGTAAGFDLDRTPTRTEAAAMLVRLLGKEQEAADEYAAGTNPEPFADVANWAKADIAWLYAKGLAKGASATAFGGARACPAQDYAVFLLRALGYQDGTDFTYAGALAKAAEAGIWSDALFPGKFTRGTLALMSERALAANVQGKNTTLFDALVSSGAIAASDAQTLRQAVADCKKLTITADGVLLDESAWRQAGDKLTITVHFSCADPSVPAGDETLAGDQIKSLMVFDGKGHVSVDESALHTLIAGWSQTHGRQNAPYVFDSYVKGPTALSFIKCTYGVDEQSLAAAIRRQLYFLASGTVDSGIACYDKNGKLLDLNNAHVEVDIDNQQLTMVKDGKVVIHTNIVTGLPNGRATPTGLYWAHHMQRNISLSGPGYVVFVKYWVSVIGDSIGLHDASWRWAFGGVNYLSNGTHGCINIPESAMAVIYQNVYTGMPVIIHSKANVAK
jgi:hypothetical protein